MAQTTRSVKVWVAPPRRRTARAWLAAWVVLLLVLALGLSQVAIAQFDAAQSAVLKVNATASVVPKPQLPPQDIPELSALSLVAPAPDSDSSRLSRPAPGFGHLPYPEANPQDLMIIASYSQAEEERFERLQQEAGLALLRMIDAARWDGIWLVPVSGFRDQERQRMLFERQVSWRGSAQEAARSVAPPGYSEHHTGYAIDLADGLSQTGDIDLNFKDTAAFRWLTRHARRFGFELSFPPDNPQGVAFEPWHWRYIGSPHARVTFAQAPKR